MTTPKQPLESLAIHLDSERTTRVRHLNWIHRLRRCGRPKGVHGLGWWQELQNEIIMEDCPCLVVFFFVCFYCYFCVVVIFFPCCLFLFLLFLLLLMLLLLLFVAMLGASWCPVLVVMLVIIAISRQDGKTVKLFDLRQWLMKEKVGTSCHPTWCLLKYFGLPKCPKRHPFFASPPGRCWFGLYWDMIYTIYVIYMCSSCLFCIS